MCGECVVVQLCMVLSNFRHKTVDCVGIFSRYRYAYTNREGMTARRRHTNLQTSLHRMFIQDHILGFKYIFEQPRIPSGMPRALSGIDTAGTRSLIMPDPSPAGVARRCPLLLVERGAYCETSTSKSPQTAPSCPKGPSCPEESCAAQWQRRLA